MHKFTFAATPTIHFGVGQRQKLPSILAQFGARILLISGGQSFDQSQLCQAMLLMLSSQFEIFRERVEGEPSPALVDGWVKKYHGHCIDAVVAIGGGSAVDAGKAVAGLLPSGDSVMVYLEGVGQGKPFTGSTIPFIAMPTTAGTGGETSKNAVLSRIGDEGFKKSFRDDALVAKHIILDPELTLTCSPATTVACGLDAFTQLLESYVSIKASAMTDALAWSGLEAVAKGLLAAFTNGQDIQARSLMLYASSLSGLTLANAGLGAVHGLASPLGAFYPIPHGVVCGTLLLEATRTNLVAMSQRDVGNVAMHKYARVGRLLLDDGSLDDMEAHKALLGVLEMWQAYMQMPRLGQFGVSEADLPKIITNISSGSMSTNPLVLRQAELLKLLKVRL